MFEKFSLALSLTAAIAFAEGSVAATATKHAATTATKKVVATTVHKRTGTASHATAHRTAAKKKPASTASKIWTTVPLGFALAKKQNRPIVVDFFTDWCGWCKVMERETFAKSDVEHTLSTGYVAVRANAEDGAEGQQLAEKLGINAYPTLMIFDADGNPKVAMRGFVPPKDFNDVLTKYLAGKVSELGERAKSVDQNGAPNTNPAGNNAPSTTQDATTTPGTNTQRQIVPQAIPNTGSQPQTGSPSQ